MLEIKTKKMEKGLSFAEYCDNKHELAVEIKELLIPFIQKYGLGEMDIKLRRKEITSCLYNATIWDVFDVEIMA